MSDQQQPDPADLARELIRLSDAWREAVRQNGLAPHEMSKLNYHTFVHGRTIAEALLAAERYIATLELANAGNKDHIAAIEGQLLAAERRVAELERTASEGWGVAGAVVFEDERDMEKMRADIDEACQYADRLRKRVAELEGALKFAVERIAERDEKCWCGEHPNPDYGTCDACLDRQAIDEAGRVLAKGAKPS